MTSYLARVRWCVGRHIIRLLDDENVTAVGGRRWASLQVVSECWSLWLVTEAKGQGGAMEDRENT